MNIVAVPVKVIAYFEDDGSVRPLRIKFSLEDEPHVIRIDRIVFKEKERIAGNEMLLYQCESCTDTRQITLELKYELRTCRWLLWKI